MIDKIVYTCIGLTRIENLCNFLISLRRFLPFFKPIAQLHEDTFTALFYSCFMP
jgi:hypothetical protein